jgi:PAS domain S-box-containing protein
MQNHSPSDYPDSSSLQSEVIAALAEGVNAVLNCESFPEAAQAVFLLCKQLLHAESGYVALLDQAKQINEPLYLDTGSYECSIPRSVPMPIRGLRESAYKTKQVVIENDFANSGGFSLLPAGHAEIKNILFAPLLVNGEAAGLLGLANKRGGFSAADARIAKAFGELVSLALANSHKIETIKSNQAKLRQLAEAAFAEAERREQAEAQLRRSQRQLQSILDNVPDIISRYDKNHLFLFTNKAIETVTDRPRDYFIGKSHSELKKETVYPLWDNCLRSVFETGKETVFEFEYDHGEGTRYYQAKFTPECDDDGEVKSVLTVNRDITDRVLFHQQKEKALKAENRLFTSGPVIVFKWRGGFDGSVEYVSPNTLEQFGYDPQDFLAGKIRYRDLVHPEDREPLTAAREKIATGTPFVEMEHRIKRANGEYRWVYNYIVPESNGSGTLTGWRGYLFDITDRKNAEQAIADSERKYRELVEDANVIIMHLGEKGHIRFINEFGLTFFGYELPELINRSIKDTILPQYESTGRDLWNDFDDIFANPAEHARAVLENMKRDGRRVWIKWSNRVSNDPVTGEIRLIAVGVDITARKRAEAALKFHYERERRTRLLSDMAEGRIAQDDFSRMAETAGIHLEPPFVCCLVYFDFSSGQLRLLQEDKEEWQAWLETAVAIINARLGRTAWLTGKGIAILDHVPERSAKRSSFFLDKWAERLAEVLKDVFRDANYIVGLSSVQSEIPRLYRQARLAAFVGPVFRPDATVVHWHDLGIGQFIAEQAHADNGKAFVQEWLGPLCEEPTGRNGEWLDTLAAIIAGESVNETAGRLYIHPKTLAFRKKKIEQLLQKKLDEPETRLNIAVALKLFQLQAKPPII